VYGRAVLRFEESLSRLLSLAQPGATEEIPLAEADGRVLSFDLVASGDLPPFDYSAMDGYAVSTSDFRASCPVTLAVRGDSRAGAIPDRLAPRSTMRIFTGAPVPEGADAVVMQEEVKRDDERATFERAPAVGQHIRVRGEDLRSGSVAVTKGTRLRPAHLSLAASLDRATLPVVSRPRVALLATGDELRRPGGDGHPFKIPEANTAAVAAMARRAGAETSTEPAVSDDRSATERAFAKALAEADVVVSIGGVSVGDHDVVRPALEAIGVHLEFWSVSIKPGKPLAVGRYERPSRRPAFVLGLPGNPASAIVTFAIFGVPLLRALQADAQPFPPLVGARMTREHRRNAGRLEFARAWVEPTPAGLSVTTFANQASGALTSMASANALALLPAEVGTLAAGADVDVLLLSDLCG
jgi:molybdopterin molybdotransferase